MLGDQTTHREPDDVGLGKTGAVQHRDDVVGQVGEGVRGRSEIPPTRETDVPPVDPDHGVTGFDHRSREHRFPQGGLERRTRQEHDRRTSAPPPVVPEIEPPIADAADRRSGIVQGGGRHGTIVSRCGMGSIRGDHGFRPRSFSAHLGRPTWSTTGRATRSPRGAVRHEQQIDTPIRGRCGGCKLSR